MKQHLSKGPDITEITLMTKHLHVLLNILSKKAKQIFESYFRSSKPVSYNTASMEDYLST